MLISAFNFKCVLSKLYLNGGIIFELYLNLFLFVFIYIYIFLFYFKYFFG